MNEEFFDKLRERILPYFEISGGHNFDHVDRVCKLSLKISEGENVDIDVVRTAALLHDIARSKEDSDKRNICHAEVGAEMSIEILKDMKFPEEKIGKVAHAIRVHRYSNGLKAETREAEIIQDADRLDALGAIIIIRIAEASVKWDRPFYDPAIPVKKVYDGSKSTGINHIYEKILKITPDSFKTVKAREIAKGRYDFVKEFAERYIEESEGRL